MKPLRAPIRPVSRHQLIRMREKWTKNRKRVVFTNGVFDILHVGHIDLLRKARSFGDVLVVGLNSDSSVRRLKGPSRPINSQRDRATVLLALSMVDAVSVFNEDTPYELIKALMPDVLVKGAEYKATEIVGADIVKSRGGVVRRVKMKRGYSTTGTIRQAASLK